MDGRFAAGKLGQCEQGPGEGDEPIHLLGLLRSTSRYSSAVLALRSATSKLPRRMVRGVFISWAAISQKFRCVSLFR